MSSDEPSRLLQSDFRIEINEEDMFQLNFEG